MSAFQVVQGVHTIESCAYNLAERLKNKDTEHTKTVAEVMENAVATIKLWSRNTSRL